MTDHHFVHIIRPLFFSFTGEHIKNWRSRYFVLREDGSLIGFKAKPDKSAQSEPLNNFTVRGCQVLKCDRTKNSSKAADTPNKYQFMLRGLQWTTVIERTFATENEKDRDEWCDAIEHVANLLTATEDIEMLDSSSASASFSSGDPHDSRGNRVHIGSTHSASRGRKITLDDFEFLKVLGKVRHWHVLFFSPFHVLFYFVVLH